MRIVDGLWWGDRHWRIFSAGSQQVADRARSSDPPFTAIGFVIGLDIRQAIEVVDHDAGGLLQAFGRSVAEPIQSLDPRAVAEMKKCHRVQRPTGGRPFISEVAGAKPDQRIAQSCGDPRLGVLIQQRREIPPRRLAAQGFDRRPLG